MSQRADFDHIEVHLIRVLHTLITERSVSRAALRLQSTQPAVSAQLKRLRALTGDPLLVRAGNGMSPTAAALQMVGPAASLLQEAHRLFNPRSRATGFEPATSTTTFRVVASDYLDPLFLPALVARVKRLAPLVRLELLPLSGDFDYRRSLAAGDVDLVIGNWLEPPEELHLGKLMSDEIVCLVAEDHPAVRAAVPAPPRVAKASSPRNPGPRGWTQERYLACEHVAPTPMHANAKGVIDEHLGSLGLSREVMVRSAHFSLIPLMVAQSLLVLTTGRLFCSRYVDSLPVRIVPCPVPFPELTYYQLWHDLTHTSAPARWLREQVREASHGLMSHGMPRRAGAPSDATPVAPSLEH